MNQLRKKRICELLKGIETGDPNAVAVVDQSRYIQHNPQTHEGSEGLETLFKRLSKTSPRVNIVRIFADGNFVFGHTEYDFSTRRIGFEVFRFEGEHAVEHWDNIQPRRGPNPSGHSMVDGPTEATDLDKTESNRARVREFVEDVLIARRFEQLDAYFTGDALVQHDPELSDGVGAFQASLKAESNGFLRIQYDRIHRILAEGSFVLTVCEGKFENAHTSFYDLFRLHNDTVAEHWDTREQVPPPSEWKNSNGKF